MVSDCLRLYLQGNFLALCCDKEISISGAIFFRSSRREVFCKKGVLRNFAKFTGKHLCQRLFFNKVEKLEKFSIKKFTGTVIWQLVPS